MPHAMNIYARDNRISESLAGLGKSRLALLEHLFLVSKKIIGKEQLTPRARAFIVELANYRVHRVQAVISHTGCGLHPHAIVCVFCSSRENLQDSCLRSSYE